MTPVHIPSLRWALCAMLADTAYAEAEKDRPNVERRLDEAGWSAQTCTQLKALALRWASKQGDDVHVTMRKALGEEVSPQEEAMLPSQARLRSTHRQVTTTLEKVAAMSIAYDERSTIVVPKDSLMTELYGEPDWTELERQAGHIQQPPWEHSQERTAKAVAAIKAGKVSLGVPATSLAYVQSEDGQRKYTVRESGCTCRATHPCYHETAAELYRLWQDKLEAPSLFPAPPTIDERLADVPGLPTAASEPQDDQQEGISLAPAVVPIEDLPVPGPCAFVAQDRIERSATVSRLMVALARAQQAMQNPACDTNNPHFRNRYASLAAVRDAVTPALTAEGIALTQLVSSEDNAVLCTTGLWHASGEYLCSTLRLPVTKADAQGYGSALTYARRYALMGICNVAGDDDDDGEKVRDLGAVPRPTSQTTPPPSGDLRADIWKLLQGQGFRGQRDEARARVLELTGLELEPANFAAIIAKLQQRSRAAAREE